MAFSPLKRLLDFASKLRFPQLFLLTAVVFVLDLVIPDVLPFADEILLGLVTALLGSMRKRGKPENQELE
ncbi:MAG: hypothetical protein HKN58_10795 [Xanthomonadales bacterium]|nr:hypothetical protein [Xanthomonadales bacterium]